MGCPFRSLVINNRSAPVMAGDLSDLEQPWQTFSREGCMVEVKEVKTLSRKTHLWGPGGLEVHALTVKHLRLTSFCFSSHCFLYSLVKDRRIVPLYHRELIKSLEDKIITCTAGVGGRGVVKVCCPECVPLLSQLHGRKHYNHVSYLSHRATTPRTNDKGLEHVSSASVQWIRLIRQGTDQDVVQGPNYWGIIE